MLRRYEALPPSLPPRGLNREAAARYIGVSPTKFDEMVGDGRMPQAKRIDTRRVWDRAGLDRAFEALPGGDDDPANPWDTVLISSSAVGH